MAGKSNSIFDALKVIVEALEPLSSSDRERVLRSARDFLGLSEEHQSELRSVTPVATSSHGTGRAVEAESGGARPRQKSLIELINEKQPRTNAQLITLFAYYKERQELQQNFRRTDLRAYFTKARKRPSGNYDRDFAKAVDNGWIYEDGDESYITSTGIEAVESGFSSEPAPRKASKATPRKKATSKARSSKSNSGKRKTRTK